MLAKIEGYIAIPQFLLYAWAQRLLGKPCAFTPGSNRFRTLVERTPKEHIFVLLFPLLTLGSAGFLLLLTWGVSFIRMGLAPDIRLYLQAAPMWHQTLWWAGLIFLTYASFSIYKLPLIFRLLRKELRHQPPQDRDKYHRDGKSH